VTKNEEEGGLSRYAGAKRMTDPLPVEMGTDLWNGIRLRQWLDLAIPMANEMNLTN
jgi:hypothetical protein